MISERMAARRIALQGLYQLDVQGDDLLREGLAEFINEATDDPHIRDIALVMARSAWMDRASADLWFGKFAEKWPIHRMATVDRNILRLAAWEMTNVPETPPKVVIDEAINMAREFSTADSPPFINGILDALLKEHMARIGQTLS